MSEEEKPERPHACIFVHKPKIADFKIGDRWTCPTCNAEWIRSDVVLGGKTYTWEKVI